MINQKYQIVFDETIGKAVIINNLGNKLITETKFRKYDEEDEDIDPVDFCKDANLINLTSGGQDGYCFINNDRYEIMLATKLLWKNVEAFINVVKVAN